DRHRSPAALATESRCPERCRRGAGPGRRSAARMRRVTAIPALQPVTPTEPAPPAAAPGSAYPPPPQTWEQLGVPETLVSDIVLKLLYFNGTMMGREIAHRACVPWPFVGQVLKPLSDQGWVQSAGFRDSGGS